MRREGTRFAVPGIFSLDTAHRLTTASLLQPDCTLSPYPRVCPILEQTDVNMDRPVGDPVCSD